MARPTLTGWSSTEWKSPDGAVRFEQRVSATRPLVELTEFVSSPGDAKRSVPYAQR